MEGTIMGYIGFKGFSKKGFEVANWAFAELGN